MRQFSAQDLALDREFLRDLEAGLVISAGSSGSGCENELQKRPFEVGGWIEKIGKSEKRRIAISDSLRICYHR